MHTPGDKRCEDVIKWTGFDGQKNAENNARYIAAFNPEVVQALLDERESQNKRIAELEKSEEQLINERDHAESALDDMYFAATGNRPEWSNWFGFSDAVDAVVDRIADLEAKQPSPVVPEGLVKAVRFYEQVKRENPPVETGAWKDAVDWVLKEACCAVILGKADNPLASSNQVGELTMLVKRLVSQLKKANPDCKLPEMAMDYLKRNERISVEDILR